MSGLRPRPQHHHLPSARPDPGPAPGGAAAGPPQREHGLRAPAARGRRRGRGDPRPHRGRRYATAPPRSGPTRSCCSRWSWCSAATMVYIMTSAVTITIHMPQSAIGAGTDAGAGSASRLAGPGRLPHRVWREVAPSALVSSSPEPGLPTRSGRPTRSPGPTRSAQPSPTPGSSSPSPTSSSPSPPGSSSSPPGTSPPVSPTPAAILQRDRLRVGPLGICLHL